jgi:glycosyltransferase involved in cell wall biosynthesis
MKITVVLPVLNEGPDLEATIAMMGQEYRTPDHVIVVDDCSIEPIDKRLTTFRKMFPKFTVRRIEGGMIGAGAAKHSGVELALEDAGDEDRIVVMDCHMRTPWKFWHRLDLWCQGHPNTIYSPLSRGFDHDAGLHYGAQLMPNPAGLWKANWNPVPDQKNIAIDADTAWRSPELYAPRIPIPYGGCYIFPAKALREIGGYAPHSTAWGYEEEFVAWRLWSAATKCDS